MPFLTFSVSSGQTSSGCLSWNSTFCLGFSAAYSTYIFVVSFDSVAKTSWYFAFSCFVSSFASDCSSPSSFFFSSSLSSSSNPSQKDSYSDVAPDRSLFKPSICVNSSVNRCFWIKAKGITLPSSPFLTAFFSFLSYTSISSTLRAASNPCKRIASKSRLICFQTSSKALYTRYLSTMSNCWHSSKIRLVISSFRAATFFTWLSIKSS